MEKAPNAFSLGAFFMNQSIHNNSGVVVIINNHHHNTGSQCSENKSDKQDFILLLVSFILKNLASIVKAILFIASLWG